MSIRKSSPEKRFPSEIALSIDVTFSQSGLTLNILLSFAQFERDIIGERIRDKIVVQRHRGKWAGGIPRSKIAAMDRMRIEVI